MNHQKSPQILTSEERAITTTISPSSLVSSKQAALYPSPEWEDIHAHSLLVFLQCGGYSHTLISRFSQPRVGDIHAHSSVVFLQPRVGDIHTHSLVVFHSSEWGILTHTHQLFFTVQSRGYSHAFISCFSQPRKCNIHAHSLVFFFFLHSSEWGIITHIHQLFFTAQKVQHSRTLVSCFP